LSLLVRTGTGQIIECSRETEADLFFATLGGMGLTGHILEVTLRMEKIPSPWIYTESYRVSGLDELLRLIKEKGETWPMTVSWLDTVARGKSMGRGILFVGRWATPDEAPKKFPRPPRSITMPFSLPSGLLNRFTIGLFNRALYFSHVPQTKRGFVDPDKFFYPLDSIHHWNHLYGASGVTQHQSVIPDPAGPVGIRRMLEELASSNTASFLTVVKDCGEEGEGLLSFPRRGMSLALDLPIKTNSRDVVSRLNAIVSDTGGRIYLTKDGLSTPEEFAKMEPRLPDFLRVREKWDPDGKLRSAQSRRLMGK
jgi:FAD/FMN-containing dehydrogenase